MAAAARPRDRGRRVQERFPSCSARESPLSGPMGSGADRRAARAGPARPRPAHPPGGPPPSPLGDWARRGPRPTQGRPFQPSPAWGSQCKARERSNGKGGGRGLAEAASSSPGFAAPNWLPSPECPTPLLSFRALKAPGLFSVPRPENLAPVEHCPWRPPTHS